MIAVQPARQRVMKTPFSIMGGWQQRRSGVQVRGCGLFRGRRLTVEAEGGGAELDHRRLREASRIASAPRSIRANRATKKSRAAISAVDCAVVGNPLASRACMPLTSVGYFRHDHVVGGLRWRGKFLEPGI